MLANAELCGYRDSMTTTPCVSLCLPVCVSLALSLRNMCWLWVPAQWKRLPLAEHGCYKRKKKKPGRQPNCTQALNTPLFTHANTNTPWSACAESILCLFDLKLQGFFLLLLLLSWWVIHFKASLNIFFITTQTVNILGNWIYLQKSRGTFYIFFVTPSLNDPSVYIHHHVLWPP